MLSYLPIEYLWREVFGCAAERMCSRCGIGDPLLAEPEVSESDMSWPREEAYTMNVSHELQKEVRYYDQVGPSGNLRQWLFAYTIDHLP